MKKFTLVLVLPVFLMLFVSTTFANKEVKVTEMVSPAPQSNVAANFPQNYKFVIKNTGTDPILVTDTIYIGWGPYVNSQVQLQTPVNYKMPAQTLAPNDTFHYTFRLTINSTTAGQLGLAFLASTTLKIADFKGMVFVFNLTLGLDEMAKAINKVYYSNGNLYTSFSSKNNTSAKLFVTNLKGQTIMSNDLNLSAAETSEIFSLGALPKGIYLLTVSSAYGKETRKFMVE